MPKNVLRLAPVVEKSDWDETKKWRRELTGRQVQREWRKNNAVQKFRALIVTPCLMIGCNDFIQRCIQYWRSKFFLADCCLVTKLCIVRF